DHRHVRRPAAEGAGAAPGRPRLAGDRQPRPAPHQGRARRARRVGLPRQAAEVPLREGAEETPPLRHARPPGCQRTSPSPRPTGGGRTFLRYCEKAGIQTETLAAEGRVVEHIDVHSQRRTYATNLIANGADPESVQEL